MPDIPSRKDLASLLEATTGVVPASAMGFVWTLQDERVAFLYSHPQSNPQRAIEWLLGTAAVRSVWSVPVPGVGPAFDASGE